MNIKKYDSIIVGGGTAGLRLAIKLSHENQKVLMVEPKYVGGTCLNVGCIPTKTLVHTANEFYKLKELNKIGIDIDNYTLNFKKLIQRTKEIVHSGREHIEIGIEKNQNLDLIRSKAKFISENQIEVENQIFQGKKIIISTGAKNMIVPIKGLEKIKYLTNENILNLKELPKSLICIGGGYISSEFASFFASLGTKVTILERGNDILKVIDDDAREILYQRFKEKNISIKTNIEILEIIEENNKKQIIIKENNKKQIIVADEILLAIGRVPNTTELDLQKAKVKIGKRKEILTNLQLQTSNKNIFALGDCNGHAMFAHSAKRQTKIILNNIIKRNKIRMNFNIMPWAVFTDPVVSGVGLSEYQLKQKNINYETSISHFSSCGRAKIINCDKGFVKIFYNPKSKKILGATIIGERADDLIHEIVAVMNSKSPTIDTIKKTIHIHPTLTEVMENLN